MPISFHNADIRFSFKQKKAVKLFIEKQLSGLKKNIHINYIFCSDEYLLDINRKFLKHDYYTDIITFSLSESENTLESEIYISIDRVKENAKTLSVEFEDELLRVMFHGVLHLLGHKDKTKAQKAAMRKLENKWIKGFKSNQLR